MLRLFYISRLMLFFACLGYCSESITANSWRAIPVCHPKLQVTVGKLELFLIKCIPPLLAGISESGNEQPRYDLGAPRVLFVVDFDQAGDPQIDTLNFMRFICGRQYLVDLKERLDGELVDMIRKSTGLQNPQCYKFIFRDVSFEELVLVRVMECLDVGAVVTYKSKNDPQVVKGLQRPFIFVSPRITDEMIIRALGNVTWERIFERLGERAGGGVIEYDADTIQRYRNAFNAWQCHIRQALQLCKQDNSDLTLCIV